MAIIRRPFVLAACLLSTVPADASANAGRKSIATLRLGGLYLGMTPAAFDAMARANPTWNEPRSLGEPAECKDLGLSDGDDSSPPYFAVDAGATDSAGRHYSIQFAWEGVRRVADRVYYAERRPSGPWEDRLAEAERRFGKADRVGFDGAYHQALWCDPGDEECVKRGRESATGPTLSLTFYPYEDGGLEPGDRIDYELRRGSDAEDAEIDAWRDFQRKAGPKDYAARLARCRRAPGGFASHEAMTRHYASLVPLGRNTSPAITSPSSVPPGVFAAIGVDAVTTFAKGVCFNSTSYFIEDEENCPGGQTGTGFRWARKTGDIWLLSILSGGYALQNPHYAVREIAPGRYRKVWWIRESVVPGGLSAFRAWRAKGAVPMTEAPRRK